MFYKLSSLVAPGYSPYGLIRDPIELRVLPNDYLMAVYICIFVYLLYFYLYLCYQLVIS